MRQISVTLTDELVSMVEREAVKRGTTVSDVVRALLLESLIADRRRTLAFAAIYDDPSMVRGASVDDALDARWAVDRLLPDDRG